MEMPETVQSVNVAGGELRLVKLFILQKTFLIQYTLYLSLDKSSDADKMM